MYKDNYMVWRQNEIKFLMENYHKLGRAECVRVMGRTKDSISSKIKDLKLGVKSKNIWLDSEIKILEENYQKFGSEYCVRLLNKSRIQIVGKANSLGFKTSVTIRVESVNKKRINWELFSHKFTKESVYILGLLWADGHIRPDKHLTTINCVKSDLIEVLPIFMKTGDWLYSDVKKINNDIIMKTQLRIGTSTWGMCNTLVDFNFINKSTASPDTMLSKIPNNLKKYWFRGYLDGDGCIKLGKKYGVEVVFAGSYEQDWLFIVKLCNYLKIKYTINRYVVKLGRYSHFSVRKKNDVKKICDYLYGNYTKDKIGFTRKYNKYRDVLNYIEKKSKLFWSDDEVKVLIKHYNIFGGKYCSVLLGKNLTSIYNKIASLKHKNNV